MNFDFIELESCESTNDEAWKRFDSARSVCVVARHQTRGRGRQGRVWNSNEESYNLLFSLALPPPSENLSWSPLLAGISAHKTICAVSEKYSNHVWNISDLRLKWPNDIYIANKKVGGILCETKFSGETARGLVVGVGLNLFEFPSDEPYATQLITDTVENSLKPVIRNDFAFALAEFLVSDFSLASKTSSENLRLSWLERAHLEKYHSIRTHDASGKIIELYAVDLDVSGKLKCKDLVSGEYRSLDQPLLPG